MKSRKHEYKELPDQDLIERLDAEKSELVQMRINHTITPLDNPGVIKEKRRNIARLHTELRERQSKKV